MGTFFLKGNQQMVTGLPVNKYALKTDIGASTLAQVSAGSLTTPNSLYTMTSTIPVEFRTSGGVSALKIDDSAGEITLGSNLLSKTTNTQWLGSATYGWRGIYVSRINSQTGDNMLQSSDGYISFRTGGTTERWQVTGTGNLVTGADNTYDIGASGATRPRTGYFGTSVTAGGGSSMTNTTIGAGSSSVSGEIYAYNSGVAKFYANGAGAIAVTSGGNFGIGSSATNVFSQDVYLNRQGAGLFGIGTNSTNALGGIALARINLNSTFDTITNGTLKNSNTGAVFTAYHGVRIARNTGVYSEPLLDISSNDSTTTGVDLFSIRNSGNTWLSVSPAGALNPSNVLRLGKETAGTSAQYTIIGHNGATTSSSDGTSTLRFESQFGNFPFTMGAEGDGYNFYIRQTNGGQGTFGWVFGTISSVAYALDLQYVTNHYEQIFTGKWLSSFSGTGTDGAFYGFKNTITPNSTTVFYDTFRIERGQANGFYPQSNDPIVSLFAGDSTATVTATNRYVARFNRLGFLGIGTTNTYAAPTTMQQAAITVDQGSKTGVKFQDGTTAMQVRTIGSSTSVSCIGGANGEITMGIMVGSKVTANGLTRTVVSITNSSVFVVDSAVDWDNGGVGYGFTYTNPYLSLQDGSTKYFTVAANGDTVIGGTVSASNLTSGTYTPTRSAEVNMDSNVTMTEAQYMRVGNTVTVSGRFTADPTLTATATSFEITLPVASNIGAVEDCAGVAFCGGISGMGAEVIGSVANNTAVIQWVSSDITSKTWSYQFSYQII